MDKEPVTVTIDADKEENTDVWMAFEKAFYTRGTIAYNGCAYTVTEGARTIGVRPRINTYTYTLLSVD